MEWWTCVVLLCVTAVLADEEWRTVPTAQGPVRGRIDPSGGLYAFYNIPYATGPVGDNKFKVITLVLIHNFIIVIINIFPKLGGTQAYSQC